MIGSHLVHRLLASGYRVAVLVRPRGNRVRLQQIAHELHLVEADITDGAAVRAAVVNFQPQVVFHLAGTLWGRPTVTTERHVTVSVLGTLHLLEAVHEVPGARVVFTGSSSVYGGGTRLHEGQLPTPGSINGAAKAAASLLVQTYAREHKLETVELRLFMPYGPWEHPSRLIPHVILSALSGEDVRMTQGTQQRDVIYIDDVIDALMLAATRPVHPGVVLNIGSGAGLSVRDLVGRILRLMGDPVQPRPGAVPMRPDEMMEMSADISAAREQLGWTPRISLDEGLRKSIAWFGEHRDVAKLLADPSPVREQEPVRSDA